MNNEEVNPATIKVVNDLFEQFVGMRHTFKQAWPTDEEINFTKRAYLRAFQLAEITNLKQIRKGLDKVLIAENPWLPAPGEFLALCKVTPEDIGAPSLDKAYNEAVKNAYPDGEEKKWSHEAIKYAYHKSDPFFLRTGNKNETKKVFKKNYEQACIDYSKNRNLSQIESDDIDYDFSDEDLAWISRYEYCVMYDEEFERHFPHSEKQEHARKLFDILPALKRRGFSRL